LARKFAGFFAAAIFALTDSRFAQPLEISDRQRSKAIDAPKTARAGTDRLVALQTERRARIE